MIKTIYTFTLDDEYPSEEDIENLKILIEYIYEDIESGIYDGQRSVLVNNVNNINNHLVSGLKRNYLVGCDQKYHFVSEKNIYHTWDNQMIYDPVKFSETSYGITVYDQEMTSSNMEEILNMALKDLHLNYHIKIGSIKYLSKSEKDESRRNEAIYAAHLYDKVKGKTVRVRSILPKGLLLRR